MLLGVTDFDEQGPMAGTCQHGNEYLGSCGEFLDTWTAVSFSRTLFQGVIDIVRKSLNIPAMDNS
jgi:hypothetical protein